MKISKINNNYIREDCLQIMIPYFSTMTLFDNSKILFHAKGINNIQINNYTNDERRKQFPYHHIPTHYKKYYFNKKIFYINQIFEYDKPYLLIRSGIPQQYYFSKTNDGATITQQNIEKINSRNISVNTSDLHNLFKELVKCKENEQAYAIDINGNFLKIVSKEESLIELNKFIDYLNKNKINYRYDGYTLWHNYNSDIKKIPSTLIPMNTPVFIIKTNKNNINSKIVKVTNINKDYYKVNIADLLIEKPILAINSQNLNKPFTKKLSKKYC